MDFDFGSQKKTQAKTGRRARSTKSKPSLNTNEKESLPVLPKPKPVSDVGKNSPARPSRRLGGWGDSEKKDRVEDSRLFTDSRAVPDTDDEGGTPDIEMIPDDNGLMNLDITDKMAAPPSIQMNQVATYRELDSDLQRHSTFTLLDNEIDLKLLAKHMSAESDVRESNDPWDWDGLFTDISSNLKSQTRQKVDTMKQDNLI